MHYNTNDFFFQSELSQDLIQKTYINKKFLDLQTLKSDPETILWQENLTQRKSNLVDRVL